MNSLVRAAVVATLVAGIGSAAPSTTGADPGDTPRVIPGATQQPEGDQGTGIIRIPVSLSAPSTETITAPWSTVFGPGVNPPEPASPGNDYTASTGTVTFLPGVTEQTIDIPTIGDTAIEGDEWIVVSVGAPTNATLGGYYGLGFGLLVDDDTLPRLVPGTAAQPEGDGGTSAISIPVTLSSPSTRTVTAPWRTVFGPGVNPPAPASPGSDYTTSTGTVTFAPGETLTSITVATFGDQTDEDDEWIVVSVGPPTNATLGGYYGLGFGVLENDDSPVPRSISITPEFGLMGGDTVTVSGAGWTPNATIGICQGVNDATLASPQSACLAGANTQTTFTSGPDGTFSVSRSLYRWGYVSGLDRWVDCGGPSSSPGCVIGAGELADLAGTVTATGRLPWAVPSPPAQRGQLSITPDSALAGEATLTVSGSGFRADRVIDIYQCEVEPVFGTPSGCHANSRIRTIADGSGAFSIPFDVTDADGTFVTAAEAVDFVNTYVTRPIAFTPAP